MLLIQIILIAFFLFAVIRVVVRFRAGDLTTTGMVGWLLFWLAAGVVVIAPDSTMYLARLLGVGRGADMVVYLALALLFYLFFQLLIKVERINKNITKLVRKNALEKVDEDKKGDR